MITAVGGAAGLLVPSWGNPGAAGGVRQSGQETDRSGGQVSGGSDTAAESGSARSTGSGDGTTSTRGGEEKSRLAVAQENRALQELKAIDRRVRAHEAAHLAAAGGLAVSGASFGFRRGPDGQLYAVSGEVSIDMSPGRTPQETSSRADRVRAAALAPADPSAQDRSVAAAAAQMKLRAQMEIAQQRVAAAIPDRQDSAATERENRSATVPPERESRSAVAASDLAMRMATGTPRLGSLIDVVAG